MTGYLARLAARGADATPLPMVQPRADPLRALDARRLTPTAEAAPPWVEPSPLEPSDPLPLGDDHQRLPSAALPSEAPAPHRTASRSETAPAEPTTSRPVRHEADPRSDVPTVEVQPAAELGRRTRLAATMPSFVGPRSASEPAPSSAEAGRQGRRVAPSGAPSAVAMVRPAELSPVSEHVEPSLRRRVPVEPRPAVPQTEYRVQVPHPGEPRRGTPEPDAVSIEVSIGRVVVEVTPPLPPSRPASPPARGPGDPRVALARGYRDRLRY